MTPNELATKWQARHIDSADLAREFIVDCEHAIGGGFHPDNRFEDYQTWQDEMVFTTDAALKLNTRMDEVFTTSIDPYGVALDVLHGEE